MERYIPYRIGGCIVSVPKMLYRIGPQDAISYRSPRSYTSDLGDTERYTLYRIGGCMVSVTKILYRSLKMADIVFRGPIRGLLTIVSEIFHHIVSGIVTGILLGIVLYRIAQ